jgi:release factor glutamine methyltransferase
MRLCFDPSLSRSEAQRQLARIFAAVGLDTGALDARLILCAALGIDHAALIRDPDQPIGGAAERIAELARRRSNREPTSRILGKREFWGLDFAIGPAVLDPRPETEILVDAVAASLGERRQAPLRILDLGIGSGAILAALLTRFPNACGVGVDISEAACRVARRNLKELGFARRASIVCGDWASSLGGGFDVIVANPPYVASAEVETLAPEVRDHDPKLSLDGGKDGLTAYRAFVPSLRGLTAPDGLIALELGTGQAADVARLLASAGFARMEMHRDLAAHERVVTASRAP